ncbi:MAG: carboxypeptidase regulatory-like domain-containing protein, partial [Burkholderiales bacterium]|nr:carboxypeptidase regulatory-like domain-containing protein [Burkholderiales bacterium]
RKSGAYLSDVKVSVRGEGGKLETVTEGPFLYASLPAGKYKIRAESNGSSQSRTVTLGRASEVFYWK